MSCVDVRPGYTGAHIPGQAGLTRPSVRSFASTKAPLGRITMSIRTNALLFVAVVAA